MLLAYAEVFKRLEEAPNDDLLLEIAAREIDRRRKKSFISLSPFLPIDHILQEVKKEDVWKNLEKEDPRSILKLENYTKQAFREVEKYDFLFQSYVLMNCTGNRIYSVNFNLELDMKLNEVTAYIPYWDTRGGGIGKSYFARTLKMSDKVLRYPIDWIGFFGRIVNRLIQFDDVTPEIW